MSASTAFTLSNERPLPHAGIILASGQLTNAAQVAAAAGTSSSRGLFEERCPESVRPRDPFASGHCPSDHHARFAAGTTLCAGQMPVGVQAHNACANNLPEVYFFLDAHRGNSFGNTLDAGQRRPDARRIDARVSLFALTGKRRAKEATPSSDLPHGEIFRHYAGQQAPDDLRCPQNQRACSGFTTKSNREETTWM